MKKILVLIRFAVSAVTLFSSLSPASAALLTMVPMQGGMVMPVVSYDAAGSRLHMTLNPYSVELIPLLVSLVTNAPAQFDGVSVITLETNESQRFFRMRLDRE